MSDTRATNKALAHALASLVAVIALAALAQPAAANVTPSVVASYPTTTKAGRHSDWRQVMNFAQSPASDDLKRLVIDAPTGLMGNPTAVPEALRCVADYTIAAPNYAACPATSDIGDVTVTATHELLSPLIGPLTLAGNIYELRNLPSATPEVPTHLGIHLELVTPVIGLPNPLVTQNLTARITPRKADTGLHIVVQENLARTDPLLGVGITVQQIDQLVKGVAPSGTPYLTNPTRCDAWVTTISTRAYDGNTNVDTDLDPAIAGNDHKTVASSTTPDCSDLPPFEPQVSVTRSTTAAGAPTGLKTTLSMPNGAVGAVQQSHIKSSVFTLPEGFEVNPAVANAIGDVGCTSAQFNKTDPDAPPTCPAETKVGQVEIVTPLLSQPLVGSIFQGSPGADRANRYRLMVYVGGGVNVKLEWRAVVADNGRLQVVIGDPAVDKYLPQFPFIGFTLDMNSGPRALVTNPQACGTYDATLDAVPWSGQPAVSRTAELNVTAGSNGSCDFDPFAPEFSAELSNTAAGANPDLTMTLDRADRQDNLRDFKVSLPPGLVGSLRATGICPAATASAGGCDATSQVGTVALETGSGSESVDLGGSVHVAEGGAGEVARLSIQVSAKVGPFDLGNTVVQAALSVRPDLGIDALTVNMPQSVQGIPVRYRHIEVKLNGVTAAGQRFMRNPTACGVAAIGVAITSAGAPPAAAAASVTLTDDDQTIGGCESLPFAPTFSAVSDSSARSVQPNFDFSVKLADGSANFKRMQLRFPPALTVNLNGLTNLCTRAEADARACGPLAHAGNVEIDTPLLPTPLTGKAYVVTGTLQLPDLVMFLSGPGIAVRFDGTNDLVNSRIVSTFENLPDLAFSELRLHMLGGPRGVLRNAPCPRANGPVDVAMGGQGGQSVAMQTGIDIAPCVVPAARPRISIKTAGARKKGNKNARFSFSFRVSGSDPPVSRLALSLPRGGKVSARGVRRFAAGLLGAQRLVSNQVKKHGRGLQVGLPSNGVRTMSIKTKKSAVTLPYKLVCGQYSARGSRTERSKLRRCKRRQLTFVVKATTVAGIAKTYRVKVRAGSLK